MDVLNHPTETIAIDSQTNATATATLAAAGATLRWRVTGIYFGYSGTAIAAAQRATLALNGQTLGFPAGVNDNGRITFTNPLIGATNGTVVLTLPAGGAGAVGDVVLCGYKEPVSPMPA